MTKIKTLQITSTKRNQMIDITDDIKQLIKAENVESGYAVIFIPHTTAAITINEGADPSVQRDIINCFDKLIPVTNSYEHLEGNSDAHIKAGILGASELVLIENKSLVLGTWQHIFLYEGDGPRKRTIYVKILSDH